MGFLRKRFSEPSTWAGLGLILTQAVQAWTTKDPQAIGAVVAGVAAIVKGEAHA